MLQVIGSFVVVIMNNIQMCEVSKKKTLEHLVLLVFNHDSK